MSVRSKILSEIADVAKRNNRVLVDFDESTPIFRVGLNSLCFVDLVLRLEDEYGTNPFETLHRDAWPVTVGDFIELYVALGSAGAD